MGCFCGFAIVNSTALNRVLIFLRDSGFIYLERMLRGGIAGSYSTSTFVFLRNLKIFLFMVAVQICIPNKTGGQVVKNLPANAEGSQI